MTNPKNLEDLKVGDKVQVQNAPYHNGTVIHQTDNRVLWKCDQCDTTAEDRRDNLLKIPDGKEE